MSSLATPRSESSASNCCLVDEVAADLVLQVGRPVELDGALDVALVVGRGVLVDLDQHDLRVVEVVLHPLGGDERVLAAHVCSPFLCAGSVRVSWVVTVSAAVDAPEEQVDLAAQAEAEDRVEQGGDQREAGRDQAERRSAPARKPTRPTSAKPRPTAWAKRGGAASSSSAGGAEPRADQRPEQPGVRRVLHAEARPRSRTARPGRRAARPPTGLRRDSSTTASTTEVSAAANCGPRGSIAGAGAAPVGCGVVVGGHVSPADGCGADGQVAARVRRAPRVSRLNQ